MQNPWIGHILASKGFSMLHPDWDKGAPIFSGTQPSGIGMGQLRDDRAVIRVWDWLWFLFVFLDFVHGTQPIE